MRVTLAQRAKAELNHALAHCESDVAAARFPEMGRAGRRAGTRELMIADTPYQSIYKLQEQRVYILEMRDSRRGK